MVIKSTSIFLRRVEKLLDAEEYAQLRDDIAYTPDMGVVIKGSGGIRKARWAAKGQGKRDGARII